MRTEMAVHSVSSVQRGPIRAREAAAFFVDDYFVWLDQTVPGLRVIDDGTRVTLRLFWLPLVIMERRVATATTQVLDVVGGLVAHPQGTFTFTVDDEELVTAMEGYRSKLPMWLYRRTQFIVHEIVMQAFLARHAPEPSSSARVELNRPR